MEETPPTDKTLTGLLEVYTELLADFRDKPVSLLEIGVDQGGSLFLWAQFFHHANTRIFGIDLKLPNCRFPNNVQTAVCDQNDAKALSSIAAAHGPFDIVIDDGSHFAAETRTCFRMLFPTALKAGGWYIIEDWAVGYWQDSDPRYQGMVEMIMEIGARAREFPISEFRISLKAGQAYAAFRKGVTGWQG